MKRFLGFIKKEFFHIFRDYRSVIVLFGMPIALIMLFGYAINTDLKDAHIAILDQSKDEITTKLTQKILSSGYFKLNANLNSVNDIEPNFRTGKIKEVIIFQENFSKKLKKDGTAGIQLIADASDPNNANLIVNYTNAIINNFQVELMGEQAIPFRINPQVRMYYNPEMKSVFMFIPGIITILLMLVSAMMTSISIAREKELGTMEVLLVSPLKPGLIILGKVIPYVLLASVNSVTIILLGKFVFGMHIAGSYFLLFAVCLLFILTALSLGIFISTVTNSQMTAMLISFAGLLLPVILLSGFIFPVENMPQILQWLSYIIPAKWFLIIIKAIVLKGLGVSYIWKELLILTGMTLFLIIVSAKKFKIRLE
ncbi:MAG TPA: ABC transporter permease [Bacteroidales bacterium]|nr:ABC transporter permease [Bacteroidales bacterium]HPS15902.1 ABC transporter permease [Bacteroidales bacterium]